MNPIVLGMHIKPDQMPTANAILILAFIPLFDKFLYPLSQLLPAVLQFHNKPLRKMGLGMLLCGCAFISSAFIQFAIDAHPYDKQNHLSGISIAWQLISYIIVTAAEILFSITGLEFAYAESPAALKSMAQAGWLLTVAVGNLLVVIIAESKLFEQLAMEMLFFAGMIWIALALFMILAYIYVPYESRLNEEAVEIED